MVKGDLTAPQLAALRVLGDGKEHQMWRQRTSPSTGQRPARVNNKACSTLTHLHLATMTDWGTVFTAGKVRITDLGKEYLAAHG